MRFRKEGIALEGDGMRVLTPCVVSDGKLRMLYMGDREIRSAVSDDGVVWKKEPGVRIAREGDEERTLSPSVVGERAYFEISIGGVTTIGSATTTDGLRFVRDPGVRIARRGANVGSPRALALADGRVRLYFHVYPQPMEMRLDRGNHVESAISTDGIHFEPEPGVRIAQTIAGLEDEAVYCAHVLPWERGFRAFYAAWNGLKIGRGAIMTATSEDGLVFTKDPTPCIAPDGPFDQTFGSEPCVFRPRDAWRMLYEGQGSDARGVTRILSAVALQDDEPTR
jgi:hypothetical protein